MINIIIDSNVICIFADDKNINFKTYDPILKLLIKKKLNWVYGGKKYKGEIKSFKELKYFKFFNELKKIKVFTDLKDDNRIDDIEEECYEIEKKNKKTFNDAHLIAVSIVGNCRIICTEDKKCSKFVKDKKFYKKHTNIIPKLYKNIKHKKMLNEILSS